jgi:hypothetical protein
MRIQVPLSRKSSEIVADLFDAVDNQEIYQSIFALDGLIADFA